MARHWERLLSAHQGPALAAAMAHLGVHESAIPNAESQMGLMFPALRRALAFRWGAKGPAHWNRRVGESNGSRSRDFPLEDAAKRAEKDTNFREALLARILVT